jgi:tRNA(Arg) A34 adenosine deaminase TadA
MKEERDALAFIGLLAKMYLNLDQDYKHADTETTHVKGLNIHALIVDNTDGEIIGVGQNHIHQFNNPMMHAEQAALKVAIERVNEKRPRPVDVVSAENYYRKFLFNDPANDSVNKGATLYTTLEPCPFCSAALLVTRMKRIVFITPDKVFGNALPDLKNKYYAHYDITYEQLSFPQGQPQFITNAAALYNDILAKIDKLRTQGIKDIHFYDHLRDDLKLVFEYFLSLKATDLSAEPKNIKLFEDLKKVIF